MGEIIIKRLYLGKDGVVLELPCKGLYVFEEVFGAGEVDELVFSYGLES